MKNESAVELANWRKSVSLATSRVSGLYGGILSVLCFLVSDMPTGIVSYSHMLARSLSRSLILWPLLMLVNQELWAAEIVGRILDAETSQGIAHAIVRAMPQQKNRREVQVETNEDGRYALE